MSQERTINEGMTQQNVRRVIVLESPPSSTCAACQPNAFVDAMHIIFDALDERVTYLRASSLVELGSKLEEFLKNDDRSLSVQIVGHGVSGQLSMGGVWVGDLRRSTDYPYHVLDSNPRGLLQLAACIGRVSQIILAGCFAGATEPAKGSAISGRALAHTLCEMFRCDVVAADDAVGPSDFDPVSGEFVPAPYHRPALRWRWDDLAPPTLEVEQRLRDAA